MAKHTINEIFVYVSIMPGALMRVPAKPVAVAVFASLLILAGTARAQERFFDEIRLGLYQHDTGIIGTRKESGADIGLEILSRPFVSLEAIGSPRFIIGGVVNSAGQTDQAYIGVMRTWNLFYGLMNSGDAIFLDGIIGGDWNDGKTNTTGTPKEQHWKSHGSNFLFRTGFNLGYRINSVWSIALSFSHISNAGLAYPNEGMNDIGVNLGMKL